MTERKALYLDADSVWRGYYVYAHVDPATGETFYIGKGSGDRAHQSRDRGAKWEAQVASIGGKWKVRILEDDLSENEAWGIEQETISRLADQLVNVLPGGPGLSTSAFVVDLRSVEPAQVRNPKDRSEADRLVAAHIEVLKPLDDGLQRLSNEDDSKLSDAAADAECIGGSHIDAGRDFLKHRMSWDEFCESLDELVEDLEDKLAKPATTNAEWTRGVRAVLAEAKRVSNAIE